MADLRYRSRTAASDAAWERRRELVRRAADCAAVGLLWTLFSLPVVTAGAAWLAASQIFTGWARDDEPPLVRTFVTAVRGEVRVGLALAGSVFGAIAVAYLDARFAVAAHVPAARLETLAVIALAAVAVALLLLAAAHRARYATEWRVSLRAAGDLARAQPWSVPVVVLALITAAALVLVVPAFILFIAGPAAFAVSVTFTRATRLSGQPARQPSTTLDSG